MKSTSLNRRLITIVFPTTEDAWTIQIRRPTTVAKAAGATSRRPHRKTKGQPPFSNGANQDLEPEQFPHHKRVLPGVRTRRG
jgi:hypothetical protein